MISHEISIKSSIVKFTKKQVTMEEDWSYFGTPQGSSNLGEADLMSDSE